MAKGVATALFVSALLASGAATIGAETEERVDAKYLDALQNLRNISQPQLEYLRHIALQSAEDLAHGFVARFREALTLNEAGRKALLAAARGQGWSWDPLGAPGGQRAMGGNQGMQDAIRRVLLQGLQSLGIPPLDPLRVDRLPDIDLDIADVLQLHAFLSDLSFDGLAGFIEEMDSEISVSAIPVKMNANLTFDVLFPRLHLLTQYNASGYAGTGVDVRGEGQIHFDIFQLRVQGNFSLRGTWITMNVQPCDISTTSRGMNLKIDGLFVGGHPTDTVGEIVTEIINEYVWDYLFETVSPIVENGLCTQLRRLSTQDWIALFAFVMSMPLPEDSR